MPSVLNQNIGDLLFGWMRRRDQDWPGPYYRLRRNRTRDLLVVMDQLAMIVRANTPMAAALEEACSLDAPNSKVEAVLLQVREYLMRGMALSEAMAKLPRFFPRRYTDWVHAGERTGTLPEVLEHVLRDIEISVAGSGTVRSATSYIALLLIVQAMLGSFLLSRVFPVFHEIYQEFGGPDAPPETIAETIATLADLYRGEMLGLVAVLIGMTVAVIWGLSRLNRVRSYCLNKLLAVPIFGRIAAKNHTAAIAYGLGTLAEGGMPLQVAITLSRRGPNHDPFVRALAKVRARVEIGEPLVRAVESAGRVFPKSFPALCGLAERSGRFGPGLRETAAGYARDVRFAKEALADILSSLAIIAAASITFFLCYSAYSITIRLTYIMIESM